MMYLPGAGFEVSRTYRYHGSGKAESKLVATQDWKKGDQIKLCTGVIADLNSEEERALKNRDFSVMYSTKKKKVKMKVKEAKFFQEVYNHSSFILEFSSMRPF